MQDPREERKGGLREGEGEGEGLLDVEVRGAVK